MAWNEYGAYEYKHVLSTWDGYGLVDHIKIRKKSGLGRIPWNALQNIKNLVAGEEVVAIEVYPKESEKIDFGNMRHLWIVPDSIKVPNLSR